MVILHIKINDELLNTLSGLITTSFYDRVFLFIAKPIFNKNRQVFLNYKVVNNGTSFPNVGCDGGIFGSYGFQMMLCPLKDLKGTNNHRLLTFYHHIIISCSTQHASIALYDTGDIKDFFIYA